MTTGKQPAEVALTSPGNKDGGSISKTDDLNRSCHGRNPLAVGCTWLYVVIQLIYPGLSCKTFPPRLFNWHLTMPLSASYPCHRSQSKNGCIGMHREGDCTYDGSSLKSRPQCSHRVYTLLELCRFSINSVKIFKVDRLCIYILSVEDVGYSALL